MAEMQDLISQVQQLEHATTDLLEATNVSKKTLDNAVTSATSSAKTAEIANNSAVSASNKAVNAASESKAAADKAVAIVHGGDGSIEPAPGNYPVADKNGHLSIGWTPLLAAMYPNSGMLGEYYNIIDATLGSGANNHDKFWINKIRFNFLNKRQAFNINGRFVLTAGISHDMVLSAAESTADRSESFDDIFLDWDGNFKSYRSVTAHPTVTSYDSDAIAAEHGYSKISTGLYKTGDTYALLLGRIPRRNAGIYDPVFNREGSAKCVNQTPNHNGHTVWYAVPKNTETKKPILTSKSACFDTKNKQMDWGILATDATGNPEKRAHDAIYADEFIPLYYSAKPFSASVELLNDSINQAVNAQTFRAAEGTPYFKKVSRKISSKDTNNAVWLGIEGNPTQQNTHGEWFLPAESTQVPQGNMFFTHGGETFFWSHTNDWAGTHFSDAAGEPKNIPETLNVGDSVDLYRCGNISHYAPVSKRPKFRMIDIFGAFESMPAYWRENGLPGNWLAFGENGESLIPDGKPHDFKLSRKCLMCYQALLTRDGGKSWTDYTAQWKSNFESNSNSLATSFAANEVVMVTYQASANPFQLAKNAGAMIVSGVNMFAAHQSSWGSVICSNLINKVSIASGENADWNEYSGTQIAYAPGYPKKILRAYNQELIFDSIHQDTPAVKVLFYLGDDGCLHAIYKELKKSDGYWEDDGQFSVIENQSVTNDYLGNDLIVGQRFVELPYH